jgi:hypothetical protein
MRTWLLASGSIVGDPSIADDPNALRAGVAEQLVERTQRVSTSSSQGGSTRAISA